MSAKAENVSYLKKGLLARKYPRSGYFLARRPRDVWKFCSFLRRQKLSYVSKAGVLEQKSQAIFATKSALFSTDLGLKVRAGALTF